MPKQGILHDYDLRANREPTAKDNTCVVCGAHPVTYQWSDLSGEAMCTRCGCPYQGRRSPPPPSSAVAGASM